MPAFRYAVVLMREPTGPVLSGVGVTDAVLAGVVPNGAGGVVVLPAGVAACSVVGEVLSAGRDEALGVGVGSAVCMGMLSNFMMNAP
jgi:hypothetical protein